MALAADQIVNYGPDVVPEDAHGALMAGVARPGAVEWPRAVPPRWGGAAGGIKRSRGGISRACPAHAAQRRASAACSVPGRSWYW